MQVWRISLRRTKSTIISWDGSFEPPHDKTNNVALRPGKTQISLGICPVWSESSLSAWRSLGSLANNWVHSEEADQTGRMPRLIWVFAGRTVTLLVLSWGGSFYVFCCMVKLISKPWDNHSGSVGQSVGRSVSGWVGSTNYHHTTDNITSFWPLHSYLRNSFLAYQTRFSSIFTSADKSYLTYPYPIPEIEKTRIPTRVVNTLVV